MIIDDNTVITGSFNFTDEESRIMPVLGGGFE
jgi:hypothetical protein